MINIEEITATLRSVDEELTALRAKRTQLVQTLHDANTQNIIEQFSEMDIHVGDCLMFFAKDIFEYSLIKTVVIEKIDVEHQLISMIEGFYSCEYDECSYRVSRERVSFSSFIAYRDEYSIYVTDSSELNMLKSHLTDLLVNTSNIAEYESGFEKISTRQIS